MRAAKGQGKMTLGVVCVYKGCNMEMKTQQFKAHFINNHLNGNLNRYKRFYRKYEKIRATIDEPPRKRTKRTPSIDEPPRKRTKQTQVDPLTDGVIKLNQTMAAILHQLEIITTHITAEATPAEATPAEAPPAEATPTEATSTEAPPTEWYPAYIDHVIEFYASADGRQLLHRINKINRKVERLKMKAYRFPDHEVIDQLTTNHIQDANDAFITWYDEAIRWCNLMEARFRRKP